MRELVVLSGKGGTGKTSIVGSFAVLAGNSVLADCDVDAADLHLIMEPSIREKGEFRGGVRACIDESRCSSCGRCLELCRFGSVEVAEAENGGVSYRIDPVSCEGCGVCSWFCESGAIEMRETVNGEWFVSECRSGPMVHARLGVAEEMSGKLVTLVREKAKTLARERNLPMVLIDGSPGTGCPVISSMTGVDLVLAVTEPTLSGLHDLRRVTGVTGHFGIGTAVCVNKWDINREMTGEIDRFCRENGFPVAGRVRFDRTVTEAQMRKRTAVEYGGGGAAHDIRTLWSTVSGLLFPEKGQKRIESDRVSHE